MLSTSFAKTSKSTSAAPASLALALGMITISVNVHNPLYALYASNDGYGVLATTIAFSCYVLGVIPVLLALGGLSDRLGRRTVMLVALTLSTIATVIMLFYPYIRALAVARLLLGIGTALMSCTATVYMIELFGQRAQTQATAWVTASTSVGFGLGPMLTTLCLLIYPTDAPASFFALLGGLLLSIVLVLRLPETAKRNTAKSTKGDVATPILRLPYFNKITVWYGCGILLCWSTTGLVLSVIPSVLNGHGLAEYAGFASMLAISCGLLFQPLARRLSPMTASTLGLSILLPAYALLAWGALSGQFVAVMVAALLTSSCGYGLVYLGGLSGVMASAPHAPARASAGYFLLAYIGLSVPVIMMGLLVDNLGMTLAFVVFGGFLLTGLLLLWVTQKAVTRAAEPVTVMEAATS